MGSILDAVLGRGKVPVMTCFPVVARVSPAMFSQILCSRHGCRHRKSGCLHATRVPPQDAESKFPLRPRMKFPVYRFQSLLIDMRVNLCRRNIGMPEHLLNDAQVSAIPQ